MFPGSLETNLNYLESVRREGPGGQLPELETPAHQWFAVRVRSNFERTAAVHLRHRGFQEFVPTYSVRSRWSDRVKSVEKPLFPGYVFCSFDPDRRLPVLATPGVLHILGIGKEPVAVDEREIAAVWKTVRSGLLVRPQPFLEIGERVMVEAGPMAGVEGTITQFKGSYRLAVSVTLLQRSIVAEMEREWIRPLGEKVRAEVLKDPHVAAGPKSITHGSETNRNQCR